MGHDPDVPDDRRDQRSPGRVPPHDLDAEAAVLGAALLSRDAVVAIRAELDDGSRFYRPWHGHVFDAICAVADRDEPVSTLTVAAELRRRGLDEAGGQHERDDLLGLMGDAPGVANAGHYARIVAEHSATRRILAVATDIVDQAFSSPPDVAAFAALARDAIATVTSGIEAGEDGWDVPDIAEVIAGGLEPELAEILPRTDGVRLLYAGKRNIIWGEPGVGKGWLACAAVEDVLRSGGSVIYADWEDSARGVVARLLAVGCSSAALCDTSRFRYLRPPGPVGARERAALAGHVADLNADLVVIDGVADAMQREGLDENSNTDWYTWSHALPRPLADMGAAVLMVDHVSKDADPKNRYGRGASSKLADIDGIAYQVRSQVPFSRTKPGEVKLVVSKDRAGGVGANGETAAIMHVEPSGGGERVVLRFEPPPVEADEFGGWQPTRLMAQITEWLALIDTEVKPQAVVDHFSWHKSGVVRDALAALVRTGCVDEVRKGREKRLRLVRLFTEGTRVPEEEPPELLEPPPGMFDEAGNVIDMDEWKEQNL